MDQMINLIFILVVACIVAGLLWMAIDYLPVPGDGPFPGIVKSGLKCLLLLFVALAVWRYALGGRLADAGIIMIG